MEQTEMAKDYYLILGIDPDATQDEIRSAYRRKAKTCHPDSSGEDSEPFLAIGEAYKVLGDPRRRRAYDAQVAREKRRAQRTSKGVESVPRRRRRCPVEPLVPTQPGSGARPFLRSSFPSLVDELFGRSRGHPATPIRPEVGRRDAREIHFQVSLTRDEALQGGRIRIGLPVQMRCPACRGWGRIAHYECPHCFGSGSMVDERPVDVAFPGGVADGSEASVSLRRAGVGDLVLRLHFRVHEW